MGMGYSGYVQIFRTSSGGTPANPALLLATSSSVNQAYTPLPSSSVWGAGWYNAGDVAHYADGSLHYEGGISFDLEIGEDGGGSVGAIWDFLMKWAVNERAYSRSFEISPDGSRVYRYYNSGSYDDGDDPSGFTYDTSGAWCGEISMNTSADSLVSADVNLMALTRDEVTPGGDRQFQDYEYIDTIRGPILGAYTANGFDDTKPLNPDCDNVNPIPFWRTEAFIWDVSAGYTIFGAGTLPQTGLETVDWSISCANNPVMLNNCDGQRTPSAILMGPRAVSGNVTLYHPQGPFDPILGPSGNNTITSPYVCAEDFKFRVQIRTNATAPATYVYLELPAIYVESDTYDIPGQDAIVNRAYSLKGLSGRKHPSADYALSPFLMSDSSGSFVAPAS